jgi:hypothetical protein
MTTARVELSDAERRVLVDLLGREIQANRFPMSERVRRLKHVRAKLLRAAKAQRKAEAEPRR